MSVEEVAIKLVKGETINRVDMPDMLRLQWLLQTYQSNIKVVLKQLKADGIVGNCK